MKKQIAAAALAALSLWLVVAQGHAAQTLYDFEQPWQFEEWQTGHKATQQCFPSPLFATSGKQSIGFKAEKSEHAPRLEVLVWDNDWDPYEYLTFKIANPTPELIRLKGFIGDGNGFAFWVDVPPMSANRYAYKIKFPKFARKNNILEFSLTSLTKDAVEYYFDDLVLYKKDEIQEYDAGKKEMRPFGGDRQIVPVVELASAMRETKKQYITRTVDEFKKSVQDVAVELPAAKQYLAQIAEHVKWRKDESGDEALNEAKLLEKHKERLLEIGNYLKAYTKDTNVGFLVGFSDPMRKIMPRHLDNKLTIADGVRVSLAGNEKEAIQISVIPFARAAQDVRVEVSDLQGPGGNVIPKAMVNCDLMSFVKTPKATDEHVSYVGWYPDPIIPNPTAVDIKLTDVQTWWVRVRAAKDQAPGEYKGTLSVHSANGEPVTFALTVEVYGFNMPPHAPIPTAITYKGFTETIMTSDPETWKTLKYQHADLLADNMINVDDIYRSADPKAKNAVDWELMKYLHDRNQLVAVNFGLFYGSGDDHVKSFQHNYDKAKELGLLDHCYIYGFDEQPSSTYGNIEEACKKFKELYPEVMVMTTAQDHSYGFDSPMKTLTAWCPIINRFNPTLAEKAREEGRRVWWYTCIWPKHPYPNIFVDYDAIDNRILSGLLTAKYKPDGFLYYHTVIWTGRDRHNGITTYPYTDWEPYNFLSTNGDGSLLCIDAKGRLLPTIRIENYRDGLEDMAYFMILEHKLQLAQQTMKEKAAGWIQSATAALEEANQLVPTRYTFTRNSEDIYAYRAKLARLIMESPVKDDNPWKGGLSVWGLQGRPGAK